MDQALGRKHERTKREKADDLWLKLALLAGVSTTVLTASLPIGVTIFTVGGVAPVLSRRAAAAAARRQYGIDEFDLMADRELVRALAERFRRQGYRVRYSSPELTATHDFVIRRRGQRIVVQIRLGDPPPAQKDVDALSSAMRLRHAAEGWLMTNHEIGPQVREAVAGRDIVLWDRLRLAGFLLETATHAPAAQESQIAE